MGSVNSAPMFPLWQRPYFQASPNLAQFFWLLWFPGALPELRVSRLEHGLPEGPVAAFEVFPIEDRDWLTGFLEGPVAGLAGNQPWLEPLKNCSQGIAVRGSFEDQPDMRNLQTGLAFVKALCHQGAAAVLDGIGMGWARAEEIIGLAPDRPFQLHEHVTLVVETGPDPLMHTRGMAKFARPELLLRRHPPERRQEMADRLWSMAEALALGQWPPEASLLLHEDDTDRPSPSHGLGDSMFRNACLEWSPS